MKKIQAKEILLISESGEKKGIVPLNEALDYASNVSLDLVQVSSNDSMPVVCKVLDYGKHIFTKKKNISSSKVKTKKKL